MKLLIVTQKVDDNDDILGFFTGWLLEFSKQYKNVTVICLEKGEYDLPKNVKVLSLGKEKNNEGRVGHPVARPNFLRSKARSENGSTLVVERSEAGASVTPRIILKLKYALNFFKYIWQERANYDKVFVHMNPVYVVLGGLFWRLRGNNIALWYTHKNVDLKLKIAEKLTDIIFSASRESFTLESNKLHIVGHGIDVNKYPYKNLYDQKMFTAVYVGRISPIKNQLLLMEALDILVNEFKMVDIKIALVGGSSDKDSSYKEVLEKFITDKNLKNNVVFVGSVPNKDITKYYYESNVSINLAPTGGMDKVVLESILCGTPAIVLNQTFADILKDERLLLASSDKKELADKIPAVIGEYSIDQKELSDFVRENYSIENLIKKIKEKL